MARYESVAALPVDAVVVGPGDVQLVDERLVEQMFRKPELLNIPGSVSEGATRRQDTHEEVASVGDHHGHQGPLRNGRHRILEITAEIGAGVDSRTGREKYGEDGEEVVHLAGNGIEGELGPEVFLEVFEAQADEALRLLLVGRWHHGAHDVVELSGHQCNLKN